MPRPCLVPASSLPRSSLVPPPRIARNDAGLRHRIPGRESFLIAVPLITMRSYDGRCDDTTGRSDATTGRSDATTGRFEAAKGRSEVGCLSEVRNGETAHARNGETAHVRDGETRCVNSRFDGCSSLFHAESSAPITWRDSI